MGGDTRKNRRRKAGLKAKDAVERRGNGGTVPQRQKGHRR